MLIMDIPLHRCLLVLGFEGLLAALSAVLEILEFSPVALEMLCSTVLAYGEYHAGAGCLLFVEFAGQSRIAVEGRMDKRRSVLAAKASVVEYAADEQSLTRIWAASKGALNDIMKMTVGSRKLIGLIEDTVVPPELLEQHAASLLRAYRDNRL